MLAKYLKGFMSLALVVLMGTIYGCGGGGGGGETPINELYTVDLNTGDINVFSRTATGSEPPLRTINYGQLTGIFVGIAVDTVNNEMYTYDAQNHIIYVVSFTATGTVIPLRTISGATTLLNQPGGLAIDTVNNELVVGNYGGNNVLVFSRTADGDVAPLRTIVGATTQLNQPIGVFVDTNNNEIVVANRSTLSGVTVYSRTANGDFAPLRQIVGASTGFLFGPDSVVVDMFNDELLVQDQGSDTMVFARTATGDVAPLRSFASGGHGLALDLLNNEIFVGALLLTNVDVYARTSDSGATPIRSITGVNTWQIAVLP